MTSSGSPWSPPCARRRSCVAACADFSRGPVVAADRTPTRAPTRGSTDGAALRSRRRSPAAARACQRCHSRARRRATRSCLLTGDVAADYAAVTRSSTSRRRREPPALESQRQRPRRRHRLRRRLAHIRPSWNGSSKEPVHDTLARHRSLPARRCRRLGCAKLESDKRRRRRPPIVTSGPHAVVVGRSITVARRRPTAPILVHLRERRSRHRHRRRQGTVTGVAVGETTITVTGCDHATASHAIVVVAADDKAQIPYYDKWTMSAHADATALAFNNWNQQGSVPVECARCHSSEGFIDYLGGDGSAPGQVDKPAPVQSVIRCADLSQPGRGRADVGDLPVGRHHRRPRRRGALHDLPPGPRRRARPSTPPSPKAAPADDDQVSAALNFQNIHYFPAAATLFAGRAKGGYQYAGQVYDVRFRHVDGYNTCIGCHDPHSTKVKFDECATCHAGVTDVAGAHEIRMMSSVGIDYDGDGDTTEGIYDELVGLRDKLAAAIRTYGSEHHTPVCYSADAYPYWFADTDGDGACSAAEAQAANAFKGWTARLLRATYNFQLATKDPGAFAHNAKYIIELLYDSITDVNTALVVPVDMTRAVRTDVGHFDGASEAGAPLGHQRAGRRHLLVLPRRPGRLPLLRAVRRRQGRPRDGQRPRVRHLPRQARRRLHRHRRDPVGDVPVGRHAPGAGPRQPVRELPPRPRIEGDRRRADRHRQVQVRQRPLPAGGRDQARLRGARRLRVRRQDLRRAARARGRHAVHVVPRSRRQPPHLPDRRRLGRHLPRLPRRRRRRSDEHPPGPHRRLRRRRQRRPSRWPPRSTAWPRACSRRCRRVAPAPGSATRPTSTRTSSRTPTATSRAAPTESVAANGFSAWTPALVKASFNYQLSRNRARRLGPQLRLHRASCSTTASPTSAATSRR